MTFLKSNRAAAVLLAFRPLLCRLPRQKFLRRAPKNPRRIDKRARVCYDKKVWERFAFREEL